MKRFNLRKKFLTLDKQCIVFTSPKKLKKLLHLFTWYNAIFNISFKRFCYKPINCSHTWTNSCGHGLKSIASPELTFPKTTQYAWHHPDIHIHSSLCMLTTTLWVRLSPWFYRWENSGLSKLPPKVTQDWSTWARIWTKNRGSKTQAPHDFSCKNSEHPLCPY